MYVLVSGRVETRKDDGSNHRTVIAAECKGRSIGEMSLIDGEPRSATCVVTAVLKSGTKVVATAPTASFSFTVENPTVAHPDVATLTSVTAAYLPRNIRPEVTSITALALLSRAARSKAFAAECRLPEP